MKDFLFSAQDLLTHLKSHSKLAIESLPTTALVCLSPSIAAQLAKVKNYRVESALGARWAFVGKDLVLVSGFGLGAPAAAAKMEEMKCLGVQRAVFIGTAGAMQPELSAGDAVLVEAAISSEGTSAHYFSDKLFSGDERLTNRIAAWLRQCKIPFTSGKVWTTDAPYRESKAELARLRLGGVLAVDMEASALFAVSKAVGVETAGVLVISDELGDGVWRPHFGEPKLREKFFQTAESLLRGLA